MGGKLLFYIVFAHSYQKENIIIRYETIVRTTLSIYLNEAALSKYRK
ncbi:hypothetical protein MED92_11324 [Oceanospirillum sp. MED92]|uniref:Uncharacterized protein n=1 Tax=Neptuniibacter caesariensis TaxID=207954 RepID=A0A7U8C6V7_NEPCE|nr:hypothetical protein MED92_11324 [Oceanospirillum sp. MED92] [Neptuniibacter caesariensis]